MFLIESYCLDSATKLQKPHESHIIYHISKFRSEKLVQHILNSPMGIGSFIIQIILKGGKQ